MSTYEPGRLYLIDDGDLTRTVHYSEDGWFRAGEDYSAIALPWLNPRPAIVLDPEAVDVKTLVQSAFGTDAFYTAVEQLTEQITAQVTPLPMKEGWLTRNGERVRGVQRPGKAGALAIDCVTLDRCAYVEEWLEHGWTWEADQ